MTKNVDVLISIIFSSIFGYFLLLAYAFGGLSDINPILYVLSGYLGILIIFILFKGKYYDSGKIFIPLRLIGMLLQLPVIYYDVTVGQNAKTTKEIIFEMSFHLMTFLLVIYLAISLSIFFKKHNHKGENITNK